METNCAQISIMTKGNERLQLDIVLAPVNIGAPGYHVCSLCISVSSPPPSPSSVARCSIFKFLSDISRLSLSQRGSSDSHSSEELPTQGGYRGLCPSSSGSEEGVQELFEVGIHPQLNPLSQEQQSPAHCTGTE